MNRAALYIILSTSLFALINIGVKFLTHLPATEVVVFRGLISLVFCIYFLRKTSRDLFGNNKKILIMRGFFGTLALLSLFICIQKIPLAVAVTLANLAPIFTVLIAHFFIGEKGSLAQWIFLIFAFAGVYLVRGQTDPVP